MLAMLINTVTKIVSQNYATHITELDAVPKEPVLFLKSMSLYLVNGAPLRSRPGQESLHHEAELAVVIGKKARMSPRPQPRTMLGRGILKTKRHQDIIAVVSADYALWICVCRNTDVAIQTNGYALALDMTSREIQSSAKAEGLPWTLAKAQDTFTPISAFLPKSMVVDHDNLELWLKVDDEIRQKGSTKDMIFKIPFLISHISSMMTLLEGDVILTGTPPGVGAVRASQKITAGITGLIDVHFDVQKRQNPSG